MVEINEILANQLLRSGTSIGANVEEAQAGQSKADFIAKLSIAEKKSAGNLLLTSFDQGIRNHSLIPTLGNHSGS